jgi:thymidylate synthase (FAD)
MKVSLLLNYPEAVNVVAAAAKSCYSQYSSGELFLFEEPLDKTEFIKRIIDSGHLSVLEHAVFTFNIEGISRACSHQLVRHRVASYSQQSQRYVEFGIDESKLLFVCPPAFKEIDWLEQEFYEAMDDMLDKYQAFCLKLQNSGRTKEQANEDARYLLPNAAKTNITVTMNARELRHFFELRICKRAQWEIRELAIEMLRICKEEAPVLFYKAGADCMYGSCKQGKHCCGDLYPKEET